MAEKQADAAPADKHDKALDLTEKALEQYAQGHPKQADKLVEKAAEIDRTAVEEVIEDLDQAESFKTGDKPAA